MGYTHYWYREPKVEQETFNAIFKDFSKVLDKVGHHLAGYDGNGKPDISTMGISFNGIGERSHETMSFPLIQDVPEYQKTEEFYKKERKTFVFCKTAQKEYDVAVTSFLIIAKHHLGDKIKVSSDGEAINWSEGLRVVEECLEYGNICTMTQDRELKLEKDGAK